MDLGADDFLSKPVRRADLLKAIDTRLKRLEGMRSAREFTRPPSTATLMRDNEAGAGRNQPQRAAKQAPTFSEPSPTLLMRTVSADQAKQENARAGGEAERSDVDGTVLFSDIRNFTTFSEQLKAGEVAELLNAYFAKACEPILDQNGWVVKFVGDGVIAMFDSANGQRVHHSERALKAALLMVLAAHQFDSWIRKRFPELKITPFTIGVGLHCGPVSICKMGKGAAEETTIIGDTVNVASRLEAQTKELGWSIVTSGDVISHAGTRFNVEVISLAAKPGTNAEDLRFYDQINQAIVANSELLQAAILRKSDRSQHMTTTDSHLDSPSSTTIGVPGESPIRLDGYRLLKKLGEGGMSQVYLAENAANGEQQVLKLIRMTDDDDGESIQRFIAEYALISQVSHPNVARIYSQGFSEAHAYISMEYFPGGDLRALANTGVVHDVAIAALIQVAGALSAIHEKGMIHRDMKPDNIMIRADGSLALADFGIAKHKDTDLNKTVAGEVFGTPSYIAPEQAMGKEVDHRADIYALGVMFFELITGKKPYRASNAQALLYQHVNSPLPDLPDEAEKFTAITHKMMAKNPDERYSSAADIIDDAMMLSS
jgi:serine/threonine-protein kinase PpkA